MMLRYLVGIYLTIRYPGHSFISLKKYKVVLNKYHREAKQRLALAEQYATLSDNYGRLERAYKLSEKLLEAEQRKNDEQS